MDKPEWGQEEGGGTPFPSPRPDSIRMSADQPWAGIPSPQGLDRGLEMVEPGMNLASRRFPEGHLIPLTQPQVNPKVPHIERMVSACI